MKICKRSLGYHLGSCVGIAVNTFTTIGVVKWNKWKCHIYRSKNHASTTDTAVEGSPLDQSALLKKVAKISETLELLFALKFTGNHLLQLPEMVDGLLPLKKKKLYDV